MKEKLKSVDDPCRHTCSWALSAPCFISGHGNSVSDEADTHETIQPYFQLLFNRADEKLSIPMKHEKFWLMIEIFSSTQVAGNAKATPPMGSMAALRATLQPVTHYEEPSNTNCVARTVLPASGVADRLIEPKICLLKLAWLPELSCRKIYP